MFHFTECFLRFLCKLSPSKLLDFSSVIFILLISLYYFLNQYPPKVKVDGSGCGHQGRCVYEVSLA